MTRAVGRSILAIAVVISVQITPPATAATAPLQTYIVVLNDAAGDAATLAASHGRQNGFAASFVYRSALRGYAARMSESTASRLASDSRVRFIAPDSELSATQFLPRGVDRIDGEQSPTAKIDTIDERVDVDVAVLDTGIESSDPELNVAGGVDCTGARPGGFEDTFAPFGHGTPVGAVIGAIDDTSNTFVGVAPGARLWSVRVLRKNGFATTAMILCGVDWVTSTRMDGDPSNDIEVANMSLGGRGDDDGNCGLTNKDALHFAICSSVAAGVLYVVSAGNEEADIGRVVPATYSEVLTVTAMQDLDGAPGGTGSPSAACADAHPRRNLDRIADDTPAFFSNWATEPADVAHTLAAPGLCIPASALGADAFTVATGTSFSAPHVAGVAANCIASGACAGLTPAQMIQKLIADAQAYNQANPGFGYAGDPFHNPDPARYYGPLIWGGAY